MHILVFISAVVLGVFGQDIQVSINVNTKTPVGRTEIPFLGFNIDAASLYQGYHPNRLDFTDERLIYLTKRLCSDSGANAVLRIGGSSADDLAFVVDPSANFTQQIRVDPEYWDQILNFAAKTGCRLVWDLNALSMRLPDGTWNHTNAELLLNHMALREQRIFAFQLGNEPGHWWSRHFPNGPWGDVLGRDFVTLRSLINRILPASLRPRIEGPDVCGGQFKPMTNDSPCSNISYFQDFLRSSKTVLDGVTVHHYGLIGPKGNKTDNCHIEDFLNSSLIYDYEQESLANWRDAARLSVPNATLIVGETATTGDGGCPGLSNSFASGFWFVHALGQYARMGYQRVQRQDIVGFSGIGLGSSYALAGEPAWVGGSSQPDPLPNPDFFTALLHQRLVGSVVLDVSYETGDWPGELSIHAACSRGYFNAITLQFSNAGPKTIVVSAATGLDLSSRVEYFMTSYLGSLTSRRVVLNGAAEPLTVADEMPGKFVANGSLLLPPFSYGFVVFGMKNITIPICG